MRIPGLESRAAFLLVVPMVLLVFQPAVATTIVNGSFESGDFSGWVTQDLVNPFVPLQVGGAGLTPGFGFFATQPTDGSHVALHGFDGQGPGVIRIGQDITVTSSARVIQFDYRAAWDLITYCSGCSNRIFDVNVLVAGGGGSPLFNQNILTVLAGSMQSDSGPQTGSIDLGDFTGQTVRLSFDFFVPDDFSGPAFFQLDNVRAIETPAFWIGNGAVRRLLPGGDEEDQVPGGVNNSDDAVGEGFLVKWEQFIGILAPGTTVGTGEVVVGAPQPWTATRGRAKLNLDTGRLFFEVHGLVQAGGNAIGTPGDVEKVKGVLVCDTDGSASGHSLIVESPEVALGSEGDVMFNDVLELLPFECVEEPDIAFLIRIALPEDDVDGRSLSEPMRRLKRTDPALY